jgi:hypothetical protein
MKLGWKTVAGGILWGLAVAASPEGAHIAGPVVSGVAQGIGIILTAFGIRHAIAKNGQGV